MDVLKKSNLKELSNTALKLLKMLIITPLCAVKHVSSFYNLAISGTPISLQKYSLQAQIFILLEYALGKTNKVKIKALKVAN